MAGDVISAQKLLVAHEGDVWQAVPCEWDSTTTPFLDGLKESWNMDTEWRGLRHEEIVQVFQKKARLGQRPFFRDFTFDKQADVDDLNKHSIKHVADPWTYSHLEGAGKLKGFHFKYSEGDPVLTNDDMIRLRFWAK